MNIQMKFTHLEPTSAIKDMILQKSDKITKYFDDIVHKLNKQLEKKK